MATNFPTSIDSFSTIPASTYQDDGSHPHLTIHNNLGDAVTAIENTIGTTSGTAQIVNLSGIQTLTNKIIPTITGASSGTKFIKAYGEYDNGNSGTAKEISWANGDRQKVTINGDACAFTFSNASAGQVLTLRVVEDGSGHTAHTWPTLKWPGGTVGTPTLTASAINIYIFYFDGTNYLAQLAGGFV
jgi:hypothetical protein